MLRVRTYFGFRSAPCCSFVCQLFKNGCLEIDVQYPPVSVSWPLGCFGMVPLWVYFSSLQTRVVCLPQRQAFGED